MICSVNHNLIKMPKLVCVITFYGLKDLIDHCNVDSSSIEMQTFLKELREIVLSVYDELPKRPPTSQSPYLIDKDTGILDILEQ